MSFGANKKLFKSCVPISSTTTYSILSHFQATLSARFYQNFKLRTTCKPIGLLTRRKRYLNTPSPYPDTNILYFEEFSCNFVGHISPKFLLQTTRKLIWVSTHNLRSKFQRLSIPQATTYSILSKFGASFTVLARSIFFCQNFRRLECL